PLVAPRGIWITFGRAVKCRRGAPPRASRTKPDQARGRCDGLTAASPVWIVHFQVLRAFCAAGGFQVPLMIAGDFSPGQYIRIISTNLPAGAGSQFASLSGPGDWFWMYRSTEPSGLALRFWRGLIE